MAFRGLRMPLIGIFGALNEFLRFAEESRERFINEMIQLHRRLGDKGAGKG